MLTMKHKDLTNKEVIYEWPDETYTNIMEDCVNKKLNDRDWCWWRGRKKKKKNVDNEYLIHRDITENEQEINWDTLKEVI